MLVVVIPARLAVAFHMLLVALLAMADVHMLLVALLAVACLVCYNFLVNRLHYNCTCRRLAPGRSRVVHIVLA